MKCRPGLTGHIGAKPAQQVQLLNVVIDVIFKVQLKYIEFY